MGIVMVKFNRARGYELGRRYNMRCPSCGQENNDLATRCSACGSILPESKGPAVPEPAAPAHAAPEPAASPEPTDALEDTTAQMGLPQQEPPAESPQVIGPNGTAEHSRALSEAPLRRREDPELREVAKVTGDYISSRRGRFSEFMSKHQKAMGIGIALLVVVVVGGAWLLFSTTNTPSYGQIEEDVSQLMPSYDYTGGAFGSDLEIPLSSVSVTKREATQVPASVEASNTVGSTAYQADAEATYDDGAIRAVRNVSVTYVLTKDGWVIEGEPAERGVSLTAREGVDEEKVLDNIGLVLNEAAVPGDTSLVDIYGEGEFSIASSNFVAEPKDDTATDDVVIHCEQSGEFYSYEGDINAQFAFESGKWNLRKASADNDATTRNFDPLMGTWTGELTDSKALGSNCFGARGEPLRITIQSVGDASMGKGQVKGTITTLAHFHERLSKDQDATEGDEVLEDFPFAGTISTAHDDATGSDLNIACTTSGTARGEISFTLSFGTDDDPSSATARVTSTHTYEEMYLFMFPHKVYSRFTDSYALFREDE